jgi:hypothetical protein
MTTIITRLYADAKTANAAAQALRAEGMPQDALDVVAKGGDSAAALMAARVGAATAAAYATRIDGGAVAVVARAPVTPFGYARKVMDVLDGFDSIRVPGVKADEYIREEIGSDYYISVLTDHPRWFSQDLQPGSGNWPGPVSRAFAMPLLKRHKDRNSAYSGTRYMSKAFWPMPLLSTKPRKSSVIPGGRKFTEDMGIPTVSAHNGPI